MSRGAKIVLGIVAGLIGLCLVVAAASAFFMGALMARVADTRPERVAAVAGEIADYTLPAGYHHEFGIHFAGLALVGADQDSGHGHIYLAKLPTGVSIDNLAFDHPYQGTAPHSDRSRGYVRVREVGQVAKTIAGRQVMMTVSEGLSSDKEPYRELAGTFSGKGGQAALLIAGRLQDWDESAVDAFIASIH